MIPGSPLSGVGTSKSGDQFQREIPREYKTVEGEKEQLPMALQKHPDLRYDPTAVVGSPLEDSTAVLGSGVRQ
jgi:hypothetical protein